MTRRRLQRPSNSRQGAKIARERQIIEEATRLFAEIGFGWPTRELARRLGITQPALYKYFPTKEHLVDRVYQEVFLRRWNPYWETLLENTTMPVLERLVTFYRDYAEAVVNSEWVRITMYAALGGNPITGKYLTLLRDRLIVRVCHVLREYAGLPKVADQDLSAAEIDLAWGLQGNVMYLAIKRFVYGMEPLEPFDVAISNFVTTFVQGVSRTLPSYATQTVSARRKAGAPRSHLVRAPRRSRGYRRVS